MRTSEEALDRIHNDPALYPIGEWTMGYMDRFDGIREIPVTQWRRHFLYTRVYYFRRNGELVWDRATRLDLIFNSTSE